VSLLDRFRPKWQHSDTEVRLAAVRQLGKADFELLGAVAQSDEDPRVRRIAVKKLDDPKLLLEIGKNDADEGLRTFASERACGILVEIATSDEDGEQSERALGHLSDPKHLAAVVKTARLENIRQTALELLSDEKTLADVVHNAEDLSLRKEALNRVRDPATLRTIASEETSELALAAVEKIHGPEALQAISEDRSASKAARRRAREKLTELVGEDHPLRLKERRGHLVELCREVERQKDEPDLQLAVEKLRAVESQWESLTESETAEESLGQRFHEACETIRKRADRRERQKAEKKEKEKELEEDLAARIALCETVEQFKAETSPDELTSAQSAWEALSLDASADERAKLLAERFAAACANYRSLHQARIARSEHLSKLTALVESGERLVRLPDLGEVSRQWSALRKQFTGLEPAPAPGEGEEQPNELTARFERAGDQILQRKNEDRERKKKVLQENLDRVREICERLETLSKSEELRLIDAFKELRESQILLKEMGPLPPSENRRKWRAKLSDARHGLHLAVQDFRETDEWRRWANVDVQEKLIRKMEALKETEDRRDAARQLREIQLEWKQASAAPRDSSEALWQRFKKARDEVRDRCDDFFTNQDKERAENLNRKKALCDKVEQLAESTDWEKTALAMKSVQEEWKTVGAVSQKESNLVWKQFRKACDHFFDRRKQHYDSLKDERENNLKKKIEFCEKAETLAQSTEWRATADALKHLQAQWKQVGPVPRKKSDAIWKRFRSACDIFFDRYKRRDEVELIENLHRKESICQEMEALLASTESDTAPGSTTVAESVQQAWSNWKQIGRVPKDQDDSIEKRFREVFEKLVATAPEGFQGTELDPDANRKKRQRLCERLEQLVEPYAGESSAPASLDNLAERLKDALASRTIGGEASGEKKLDWREATQQVKRLKNSWDRLGPVPGEIGETLVARFQKAYNHFFELRPNTGNRSAGSRSAESSVG
jgi:hypothetical protein